MAYFYDPKEKKAYKVIDCIESEHQYKDGTKLKNPTLYVQTKPGYQKRVSALRMDGFSESASDKKWNDNIFKALKAFKKK